MWWGHSTAVSGWGQYQGLCAPCDGCWPSIVCVHQRGCDPGLCRARLPRMPSRNALPGDGGSHRAPVSPWPGLPPIAGCARSYILWQTKSVTRSATVGCASRPDNRWFKRDTLSRITSLAVKGDSFTLDAAVHAISGGEAIISEAFRHRFSILYAPSLAPMI